MMAAQRDQTARDQVFCLNQGGGPVWKILVNGQVYGDWDNKGVAMAAMQVQQRRDAERARRSTEREP